VLVSPSVCACALPPPFSSPLRSPPQRSSGESLPLLRRLLTGIRLVTFVVMIFLIRFGWFGFNAGSALAANGLAVQAFLTTNTATAAAMLTWVFVDHIRGSKSTAMGACVGAVVGLVSITPACGYVTVGGALCIGIIAAILCNVLGHLINERSNVDDTLDVFSCHGLGGTIGFLLTGCFSSKAVNPWGGNDGAFYGNPSLLAWHLAAVCVVVGYVCTMAFVLFHLTNLIYPLRVSDKSERLGLDMTQVT
jgi:ammonium transporter, Amt family